MPALAGAGCTDDTRAFSVGNNAPSARDGHTAIWTGAEMIVWAGRQADLYDYPNMGGRWTCYPAPSGPAVLPWSGPGRKIASRSPRRGRLRDRRRMPTSA